MASQIFRREGWVSWFCHGGDEFWGWSGNMRCPVDVGVEAPLLVRIA